MDKEEKLKLQEAIMGRIDLSCQMSEEEGRERIYLLVREMSDTFRRENGTIICRELLGLKGREQSAKPGKRTQEYYESRPCSRLVACAAKIVEEMLLEDMD